MGFRVVIHFWCSSSGIQNYHWGLVTVISLQLGEGSSRQIILLFSHWKSKQKHSDCLSGLLYLSKADLLIQGVMKQNLTCQHIQKQRDKIGLEVDRGFLDQAYYLSHSLLVGQASSPKLESCLYPSSVCGRAAQAA